MESLAPVICSQLWHFINLFTDLLTHKVTETTPLLGVICNTCSAPNTVCTKFHKNRAEIRALGTSLVAKLQILMVWHGTVTPQFQ